MDELQHIFELSEEGEWVNGRAHFHKSFYDGIRKLDESQRIALVSAFDEVESPTVRFSILEAIQFLKLDVDVNYWLNVMRDSDQLMAIRAKIGMVLAQRLDAAEVLLNEFVRESPGSIIAREMFMGFMFLIQESHPKELETALINCLHMMKKSEDPYFVFELLKMYKSSNIVDAVSVFLQDDRAVVRAKAIDTLTSSGDTRVIALIIPFLDDVNVQVRSQAIYSLRQQFNIDHTTVNTLRKATRALNDYNDSL